MILLGDSTFFEAPANFVILTVSYSPPQNRALYRIITKNMAELDRLHIAVLLKTEEYLAPASESELDSLFSVCFI
jgi:hypothetical protein